MNPAGSQMTTRSAPEWDTLRNALDGELILPGAPDYEQARRPAIPRFDDAHPRAVVRCRTTGDVSEVLALARRAGLDVAVRSGGHCFAGRSSGDGIVVDVSPMNSVSYSDGVATVGAGARLGDVYDALDDHGVTIPAGCGPEVGIAGLTLGGGLGILGRRHGLTADQLIGARVVLAGGRVVDCDEHHDEELFWGLRGAGGGQFGVVTSLAFRTVPAPAATSFHVVWPGESAAALIEAWQSWAPDAPDEMAASLLVTAEAGSPLAVNLFGAMAGSEADAGPLLAEFVARGGHEPTEIAIEHLPYRATKSYLAERGPGDAPEGWHPYSKSEYFRRPLSTDAIESLLDNLAAARSTRETRVLDFTPWGGAYNRVAADATAFAHREERFLIKHGVMLDPEAPAGEQQAARLWLTRSWEIVHPFGSGGVYANFPDPELDDWERAYHGDNYARLARVKAEYDPANVFTFPQSVRA
jgi:FAD/FMN-containing dehydrogenase